jgi:DNA-binding MarR family transcriptional regulator
MIFTEAGLGRFFELVSGIYINYRRLLEGILKKHNLTYPQMGALLVVSGKGEPLTQTKLAETLETDTTNGMVICDSLEKKGLIVRSPNPGDRRSNLVSSTAKGDSVFRRAFSEIGELMSRFEGRLSGSAIDTALPALEEVYKTLKKKNTEDK